MRIQWLSSLLVVVAIVTITGGVFVFPSPLRRAPRHAPAAETTTRAAQPIPEPIRQQLPSLGKRQLLILWQTADCTACRQLKSLLESNDSVRRELESSYELLPLDAGVHASLLERYVGRPEFTDLPVLTVVNAQGNTLANGFPQELADNSVWSAERLTAFLSRWSRDQ